MSELKNIKKRDGKIVPFMPEKITEAIYKAAKAVAEREGHEADRGIAEKVTDRVIGNLEQLFANTVPTVEQVQDIVERTLIKLAYSDTAKTYILYREKHKEKRELDAEKNSIFTFARRLFSGYTGGSDWRSKENANSGSITFQGANARFAGELWNLLAKHHLYTNPEIGEAHDKGQLHVHDLDFPVVAYCCGHSLEKLLKRGFGDVAERVQSSPAKHLRSAINQMVNYVGTMQGEFAGAQAFSSVDTYLAPFVRADNDSFEEVKQSMQELIFGLNVPSRWGWQAPFSNLTFDLTVPEDLKEKKIALDIALTPEYIEKKIAREKQQIKEKYGAAFSEEKLEQHLAGRKKTLESMIGSTYKDYQKEMDMINKAYMEVKLGGDKSGRIFTFPIDTYNLTKSFNWDSEISDLLFEVTGKYGIPYFQNYLGSNLDPGAIRAMCCRLNINQNELRNRPGNMWGPGDSTGSVGVVTINMNRIGYEAHSEDEYFKILGHRMDLAKESLEIKRAAVTSLLETGFVPYTKSYLGHFDNHFSTIGLVGMNEGLLNFMKKGIETDEGKEFTKKTLNFMRDRLLQYQAETKNLYNLEATPAEGTSYRLAKLDKEFYPNIVTSGNGTPYLTNSTQLPVNLDIDLFAALKHQDELQTLYTGGTIFHTFIGERLTSSEAKTLVRKIAENTKLPYFSLTPVFSICNDHGYMPGIKENCPSCGKETEVYDRIVGYIRPVKAWNPGKQEEFKNRRRFATK